MLLDKSKSLCNLQTIKLNNCKYITEKTLNFLAKAVYLFGLFNIEYKGKMVNLYAI